MWGAFTWGNQDDDIQAHNIKQNTRDNARRSVQLNDKNNYQQAQKQNQGGQQTKKVTFNDANTSLEAKNSQRAQSAKKTVIQENQARNNNNFQRKSKIVKDEEAEKAKNE